MGSTQPMWTYVMGWVGLNFFLTHHGGLGQKIHMYDSIEAAIQVQCFLFYTHTSDITRVNTYLHI